MDIKNIERGDTLYVNHHVAEPRKVDPNDSSGSTVNFTERSARVTVDEINEKEETVVVSESDETQQWVVEIGHLLRGGGSEMNDES